MQAWYERFKAHGDETCESEWQVLKESKKALMFERHSDACEPFEAQHALYNLLYGKREVFLMIATRKGAMDADTRDGWMQLLQTAKVHR